MLATALSCSDKGRARTEEHARRFRTLAEVGQDVAAEIDGDRLRNQTVMSAFFHQFYRVMAEAVENTSHHVNWEYPVLNTRIPFALRARGGWTSLARRSWAPRMQRRLSSEMSPGRLGEEPVGRVKPREKEEREEEMEGEGEGDDRATSSGQAKAFAKERPEGRSPPGRRNRKKVLEGEGPAAQGDGGEAGRHL